MELFKIIYVIFLRLQGDNGDPLSIGDIQVGIYSFFSAFGCATGRPTGYTRLTHYRDWIRETTGI